MRNPLLVSALLSLVLVGCEKSEEKSEQPAASTPEVSVEQSSPVQTSENPAQEEAPEVEQAEPEAATEPSSEDAEQTSSDSVDVTKESSASATPEKMLSTLHEECVSSAVASNGEKARSIAEKTCECAISGITKIYSAEELKALDDANKEKQAEFTEVATNVTLECTQKLLKEAGEV